MGERFSRAIKKCCGFIDGFGRSIKNQDIQGLSYTYPDTHCPRVMAGLIAETSKENDRREIFFHPPFFEPLKMYLK
jgi:hypothetical protein